MLDKNELKEIMEDIEKYLIQNDMGFIILPGYEWYRDILTLYAKQHNLLEAILVLLDNNMCEEAIILCRTVLNNYFLIGYLINDETGNRIKEFHIQPWLSQKMKLENMRKILKGPFGKQLKQKGIEPPVTIEKLNEDIKVVKKEIKKQGFKADDKPLSIVKLAKHSDERGFELYSLIYTEASKYEHSDISSLEIYKKEVENIDKNIGFIMDTNSTDEKLRDMINSVIIICYLSTFIKILEVLKERESHLLKNYDLDKLVELSIKVLRIINN